MALVNCPECGNEISDKAQSCPKCGYPIACIIKKEVKIKTLDEFTIFSKSTWKCINLETKELVFTVNAGSVAVFSIDSPIKIKMESTGGSYQSFESLVEPGQNYEMLLENGLHWKGVPYLSRVDNIGSTDQDSGISSFWGISF